MTLPVLGGLGFVKAVEWKEFREKLRDAGLVSSSVWPFTTVGRGFPEPFRRPLIAWHLRQTGGLAAIAMRLLMFRDSVTDTEANALLGHDLCRRLQDAGLFHVVPGGLVCPFDLNILDDLYILCDDLLAGRDAVMGAGVSSLIACRAALPRSPVASILDLGCGAGTASLLFAKWANRIVGTDINPRAVVLSRINAAFNAIERPEFVLGDLFEPIGNEQFDLIVSQPPFIARAPGAARKTFLYGGSRGDELPLRVLREIPSLLAPDGQAVLLIDWPEDGQGPVEERVLGAVGGGLQTLLLRGPGMPLDDHCIAYALGRGSTGRGYERRVQAAREQYAALGITSLTSSVVVLRRAAPAWTAVIDLPVGGVTRITSEQVAAILRRETLLASDERELIEARLTTAPGLLFLAMPDGRVRAEFPSSAVLDRVEFNGGVYRLIEIVGRAPTVGAAITDFAHQAELSPTEAAERVLPAVREALRRGLLETAVA